MFPKVLAALFFAAAVSAQVTTIPVCCGLFQPGDSPAIKALIGAKSKVPEGDFGQFCYLPSTPAEACKPLTQRRDCQYFAEKLGFAAGCGTSVPL